MKLRQAKPKFATRFNRPDVISAPMGNGERDIFEERVVDGVKQLVITGKENFKDFIEASKNDTLISNIMRRFEQGDVNVLQRVQGFFGDVTGMPSNLADAQNMLISLEHKFNALPVEIKKKFNNSFDKYVRDVSSATVEQFNDYFGISSDVPGKVEKSKKESVGAVDEQE